MLQSSVLLLVLCAGTLVESFRIAEAEPGHHQVCLRAAMASDGHFALAWVDSLQPIGAWFELNLYIRFFDSAGNPMTEPYQIAKMVDTNWIYWPCLDMDTAGNVVLVCMEEDRSRFGEMDNRYIRFQRFEPNGSPVGSAQTLVPQIRLDPWRPLGSSLANNDEFAIAWCAPSALGGNAAWVQRFDREGHPKGNAFLAHDDFDTSVSFYYPQVALNDTGDLVVTWYEFGPSWPRFQVFDAEDEPILDWKPMGHLVNENKVGGSRVEAYWLDNDRFALFWIDYAWPWHVAGRVFADRGLARYPICRLVCDSLALTWPDPEGRFTIALSSDERFAETHTRNHSHPDDIHHTWEHQTGVLGRIVDNEPWRRTNLFEYTPPWETDTIYASWEDYPYFQFPAVGACDNRIVWVYSRFNTDTIFEAYAMITDWDMGVGVTEQPPVPVTHQPDWQVTPIGSQIVLRYSDSPEGFHVTIFDVTGRKVDELHASGESGTITWGEGYGPGVYFIRSVSDSPGTTHKVILIQ